MDLCRVRFGAKTLRFLGLTAVAIALPGVARAHHFMGGELPRTLTQGLLSGLAHPVVGVDHLAFIVAMGFLLATVKGGLWGVASFMSGTLAGAIVHLAKLGMPWGEVAVALSVVGIAVLIVMRARVPLSWLAPGLAIAGVLHGHAYAEAIFGAEPGPLAAYLAGFSMIQLAMAAAALGIHRRLRASAGRDVRSVSSALGAVVGVVGVYFLGLQAIA